MAADQPNTETRRRWCRALEITLGIIFLFLLDVLYGQTIKNHEANGSSRLAGFTRTGSLPPGPLLRRAALAPRGRALPHGPRIFTSLTVCSFLWFVIRFSKEFPGLAILAAFSIPMFLNINGWGRLRAQRKRLRSQGQSRWRA